MEPDLEAAVVLGAASEHLGNRAVGKDSCPIVLLLHDRHCLPDLGLHGRRGTTAATATASASSSASPPLRDGQVVCVALYPSSRCATAAAASAGRCCCEWLRQLY